MTIFRGSSMEGMVSSVPHIGFLGARPVVSAQQGATSSHPLSYFAGIPSQEPGPD